MPGPPLRSVLFMPASNPRMIAKASDLPADAIILDLEDAVAPDRKDEARGAAAAAAPDRPGGKRLAIRINGRGTRWHADDARLLASVPIDAIVLPKVDRPADLVALRAAIGAEGPPIWAMIETCAAILALPDIVRAAAETRTTALIAGTNDLALDMRCRPDAARTPLVPALSAIVTAARAAGLHALDGVCNAIGEPDRLAAECSQGAMLGFDGKTLIHPTQIDPANAAFGPSGEQLDWAHRVIAAFHAPTARGKGAIQLDGAMIERLHLAEAERIVALAR